MNAGAPRNEKRTQLPDSFDLHNWDIIAQALEPADLLLIPLPSHVPELFQALTDSAGDFPDTIEWVAKWATKGQRLALLHHVDQRTLREIPDFVRFVDDRFRTAAGIVFTLGEGLTEHQVASIRPWWQAARTALVERELGWEKPAVSWWPDSDESALNPPPPVLEYPAAPEDCVVMATNSDVATIDRAIDTILDKLGGFERFIHPAKLDLPAELLARYCADEPRDNERIHRAVRAEPWVLLNLGWKAPGPNATGPSMDMIAHVIAKAHEVGTRPFVAVRTSNDSLLTNPFFSELASLCTSTTTQLLTLCEEDSVVTNRVDDDTLLHFDFVVHLGHATAEKKPFIGAVNGMWGLLPSLTRGDMQQALNNAFETETDERSRRPLSAWHRQLLDETLAEEIHQRTREGYVLNLKHVAASDFWMNELHSPKLVLGSTDPFPMDRFILDTLGVTPTDVDYMKAAIDSEYAYALHRGVRISGDTPPDRVLGSEKPSFTRRKGKSLAILGLASTTLQNHAATLLVDGQIVAAVQEERIRRRKQIGWHPTDKPNATVVSDGTIPLDRAYPWRAIQKVLAEGNLAFEDVDVIALNGIPSRFFDTYSLTEPSRPPRTICHENFVFVPHHLTHAASAYRVSGFKDAYIFTVDGRGERETAAFFEARDGRIDRIFDVLCHEDSLIGGVYEYITTILGFGHHGQGSTMGLAPMGQATFDVSHFMSAKTRNDYSIHDRGIMEAYGHLVRDRHGPLEQTHLDLAASLQNALEETVLRFIEDGLDGRNCDYLCLAGGVALNCSMNQRIRQHFGLKDMYIQPAAHDAGTSLGAALEAHWLITGEAVPTTMNSAYLGPSYSKSQVLQALTNYGVPYSEPDALEEDVAQLISEGAIVCRFAGRSEFGPRALGARSILADPRSSSMKARLNTLKRRQWWRPFGPSVLAGHETEYFENAHISPFMLFTLPVRPEKQARIPAVIHVDGTTRPQSVTREANPLYHQLIQRFYEITGVPMVVNTSFNTAFEPIVETPEDAISTFLQIGADYLAIEGFLVSRRDIEAIT
jgi:predicted NodU family carbamoyl transferase